MNEDFLDLLAALARHGSRFLVVGAHALAVHGVPRATGDLDVWVACDRDNACRTWEAVREFGPPVEALGVTGSDLATPGVVIQIGLPPRRIDLLTSLTGLEFEAAWATRVEQPVEGVMVAFLGRDALIANKRACARAQDLADIERLEVRDPERGQ